jgi:hypothetical protein
LPEHAYKAPNFVVIVYILQSVALLIMPWYVAPLLIGWSILRKSFRIPPKGGSKGGDVGFFYATYCVVAVLLLLVNIIFLQYASVADSA